MDNVNYDPPMLREVVRSGAFADDPFVLLDVGCALGIDAAWRLFEPHLVAHAFDPQVEEIDRLRDAETNANVHYHAALIGLPDGHPFLEQRRSEQSREQFFNPWARLSTTRALEWAAASGPTEFAETNDWSTRKLESHKTSLSALVERDHVENVDFVKTDTDGSDIDVLYSFLDAIESTCVMGFMVEASYVGSECATSNSFHNVDRLLRQHGFQLVTLSAYRYSRVALPAPFAYRMLAQTTSGQTIWGDVVYLRDGLQAVPSGELSPTKLLKLACLWELYRVPDAAAEILVGRRESLAPLVDVDQLLELLTPPLNGRRVSYREYVAAFEEDPTSFYPGSQTRRATEAPRPQRSVTERIRRRLRRVLGS